MVGLKQSWVLREGNTPRFPARVSMFEQLGQPGPQRNSWSVCQSNALMLLLGTAHFAGTPLNGITLGWAVIFHQQTRIRDSFPCAANTSPSLNKTRTHFDNETHTQQLQSSLAFSRVVLGTSFPTLPSFPGQSAGDHGLVHVSHKNTPAWNNSLIFVSGQQCRQESAG